MSDKPPSLIPNGKQNPEYEQWWRDHNRPQYRLQSRKAMWKKRGINPVEAEVVRSLSSVCAICGKPVEGKDKHLDHNHKTSTIRGVLCNTCNVGLGAFKDDPNLLKKAEAYLKGEKVE